MKEILFNLALLDAINFCKAHGIDCSGTFLLKYARGYKYALVKEDTKQVMLDVLFKKNSVPEHIVYKQF